MVFFEKCSNSPFQSGILMYLREKPEPINKNGADGDSDSIFANWLSMFIFDIIFSLPKWFLVI